MSNKNISELYRLLSKNRFSLHNEKVLQSEIQNILIENKFTFTREFYLDKKNILDFFIDGIGIEIKIKGSKRKIYDQCVRYCSFEEVKQLLLITNVATGFPSTINNKPCYILNLGTSWL